MNQDSHDGDPIQAAASKIELIEGLQRALDLKYRRLLKIARTDWERLFGKDLSDAANIRIQADDATGRVGPQPGSGFLEPTKVPEVEDPAKRGLPRFAQ